MRLFFPGSAFSQLVAETSPACPSMVRVHLPQSAFAESLSVILMDLTFLVPVNFRRIAPAMCLKVIEVPLLQTAAV